MKNLYESILSNTKTKINKTVGVVKNVSTVPAKKDFKKTHSRFQQFIVWECTDIMNIYRKRYPNMIDNDHTGLLFMIDTSKRLVSLEVFLSKRVTPQESEDKKIPINSYNKRKVFGWDTIFYDGGVREAKEGIIGIMTKLAENPDKLDAFFEHAYDQFEKFKAKGWVYDQDKSLIYEL